MKIPNLSIQQLLEAGVHLGHKTLRWNPKMKKYIFGKRDSIHIIDLTQTLELTKVALEKVYSTIANNGKILFVSTKKQASEAIAEVAKETDQYFVNYRWLGGMLTNWGTISNYINKLKKLGIEIVHESNGVGKNLQDHLMFRPVYKVKNLKSLNRKVESLFGRFLMGLEYLVNQSGPVTMGASQVCGFVKSDPSRATPNLQFHVSPVSTDVLGVTPMHDFEGITPTVANVRPTSRGEINIVSNDSRVYPKIKMNYLSTDDDRKVAAQGLKIVRKIMLETETFKQYEPEEYRPGVHITDDEELVKAGSDFTQTIFHPVGTCKMGNDDMAVVDDSLKVRGIQNLRVIDASIMPNITSGNTNAPTIMIAEKGADMILNG